MENKKEQQSGKDKKSAAKKSGKTGSKKVYDMIKKETKGTGAEKGVSAAIKVSQKIKTKKHGLLIFIITIFVIAAIIIGCWIYDTKTLKVSDFFYDSFYGLFNKQQTPKGAVYSEGDLIVHFVDVGQGDSMIIQFPDNKVMIIDGGPRKAKDALLNYIDSLNIKIFDYLLLTHSDEDHCGSLTAVITKYEIKTIFMPDVSTDLVTTTVYKNFVTAAEAENAKLMYSSKDSGFESEEENHYYKMDFVTPNFGDYAKVKKSSAELINSVSPIMVLTFVNKKIMFTGDANRLTEEVFLQNIKGHEEDYNIDILKVGHHGSATSTTSEFLQVIKPEIAVIEVGAGNKYGHPTAETLTNLKKCNNDNGPATVYRTDLNGNIVIKLTASGELAEITETILGKGTAQTGSVFIWINIDLAGFSDFISGIYLNIKKVMLA